MLRVWMPEQRKGGAERLQRVAALGLAVAAFGGFGWHCAMSPEVTWIAQTGDAAWITDPRPVDAAVQQYGRRSVPVASFARRFELDARPARAELRVRAARAWRVRVNGVVAGTSPDPDPSWRSDRSLDVAEWLRVGANELSIEVWNPRGPPLLRARLALPEHAIATDVDWSVSVDGGSAAAAVLPDDTRGHPSEPAGPRPARALSERGAPLGGLFALAWLAWASLGRRVEALGQRLPWLALALVHALWLALLPLKFARIPLSTGFDATNHLRYVELLREHHALPAPDAGWSTYHPPLYYALLAGLQSAFESMGPAASALATKSVSFAAGLGLVWISFGLSRALLPGRPGLAAIAVLFAGCLPLDLYMAAFVSNEPLHAFWFGLGTLAAARALARNRVRVGDAAAVGTALGLALVTKVTALVLAGVASACLLGRAALVERTRPLRLAALAAALAAPPLALAGWFYARNLRLYGQLVVGNWNLPALRWWSQPGFHGAAYYLGFGDVLRLPVFAGFHSFADALYSSFWGDGWIAGRASAAFPTEAWSWPWAALGYWLALPATAVLAVGVARGARLAFATGGARRAAWSFVVALEAAMGLALVWLTLELPYFGQAKAPYLLGIVPPLAVGFALGAEACDAAIARVAGPRAAAAGRALLTATGAVFALSFMA